MSFTPPNNLDPDKKGPSTTRIAIWVIVGAFALYLIGSGLYGILTK